MNIVKSGDDTRTNLSCFKLRALTYDAYYGMMFEEGKQNEQRTGSNQEVTNTPTGEPDSHRHSGT